MRAASVGLTSRLVLLCHRLMCSPPVLFVASKTPKGEGQLELRSLPRLTTTESRPRGQSRRMRDKASRSRYRSTIGHTYVGMRIYWLPGTSGNWQNCQTARKSSESFLNCARVTGKPEVAGRKRCGGRRLAPPAPTALSPPSAAKGPGIQAMQAGGAGVLYSALEFNRRSKAI